MARAHFEAARAIEKAHSETAKVEALRDQFATQQADLHAQLQHVRQLKANMARRARDADVRASTADNLQTLLDAARQKLAATRKELTSTRIELSLQRDQSCEDDSEVDDSGEPESDSGIDNEDVDDRAWEGQPNSPKVDAALAVKRMRSMPSWQPERGHGAGRGGTKMHWKTRVVIYALLALMVPPSAIGAAIVTIVSFTASWLRPAAPTHATIRRCRFELRLVEEAISARRIASAYRLKQIGFDETTKLGNSSLTSNLQIEATQGARFEDVILRAAYCPMGGTSELVVKSIEMKCFVRLRDLLRRWKAKFEEMFPREEWTGPDGICCCSSMLHLESSACVTDCCAVLQPRYALCIVWAVVAQSCPTLATLQG